MQPSILRLGDGIYGFQLMLPTDGNLSNSKSVHTESQLQERRSENCLFLYLVGMISPILQINSNHQSHNYDAKLLVRVVHVCVGVN